MIELPEPKCYTHISWLKAPSGCIVTEPHASFPISLFTADQLRTYGDQRAAEAREQMREECIAAAMAEHENPNNLELIQIGALQAGRAIRKLP